MKSRLIFAGIGFALGGAVGAGAAFIWHLQKQKEEDASKQGEIDELKRFYADRVEKEAESRAGIKANDIVKQLIASGYIMPGGDMEVEGRVVEVTDQEVGEPPEREVVYPSQTVTRNFFDTHPSDDGERRPDNKAHRQYSRSQAKRDIQREMEEYDAEIAAHAAEIEQEEIDEEAARELGETAKPTAGNAISITFITEEEYEYDCTLYAKLECIVYLPSHQMCLVDGGEIIDHPELYTGFDDPNYVFDFGPNYEEHFRNGGFSTKAVFTRNADLQTDCRIIPSMRTYEEDVLGVASTNLWPGA